MEPLRLQLACVTGGAFRSVPQLVELVDLHVSDLLCVFFNACLFLDVFSDASVLMLVQSHVFRVLSSS